MKRYLSPYRTRWILLASVLAGAFLPTESGYAQGGNDTIVVAHEAAVPNLDPAQALGLHSLRVIRFISEGLVTTKKDEPEVSPLLAKSWDISPNGLEWTFHLQENVRFHDGEPLTAEAVKYSYERFMDPKHPEYKCGKWTFVVGYARPIKRIDVVNAHTVKLVLHYKHAGFLGYLSNVNFGIVSPKAAKQSCNDFGSKPVGTGPYRLETWQRGVKLSLIRNEHYWGKKGAPKRIIFRPVPEEQTRVAELLSGGVDVIVPVFPDSIPQVEKNKDTRIIKVPGLTIWYVALNLDRKIFQNQKVRQALNYAIDREAIVRDVLKNTGIVATQAVHPSSWGHNPNARKYPYDPERAKKLLAEAGFPNGFSLKLWAPTSGSGMQLPKEMAQVIQANLAAIGVQTKLEVFEWGTYLAKVREKQRSFDMAAMSWYQKVRDPDVTLYPLFYSKNVPFVNLMKYNNPEVDRLLGEAREVFDEGKRKVIYQKIVEIVNEEVPWIPIDHQYEVVGVRANVHGVSMNPNGWLLSLEDAYKK